MKLLNSLKSISIAAFLAAAPAIAAYAFAMPSGDPANPTTTSSTNDLNPSGETMDDTTSGATTSSDADASKPGAMMKKGSKKGKMKTPSSASDPSNGAQAKPGTSAPATSNETPKDKP